MVCNWKFNNPPHRYKGTGETEGRGRVIIQELSVLPAQLFCKPKIKSTNEHKKVQQHDEVGIFICIFYTKKQTHGAELEANPDLWLQTELIIPTSAAPFPPVEGESQVCLFMHLLHIPLQGPQLGGEKTEPPTQPTNPPTNKQNNVQQRVSPWTHRGIVQTTRTQTSLKVYSSLSMARTWPCFRDSHHLELVLNKSSNSTLVQRFSYAKNKENHSSQNPRV